MQQDINNGMTADAEISATAVAWPAVLAGAFAATAISLCLIFLGAAFGFASYSPWHSNPSAVTFTAVSAIWLIVMQWVSSALGGYLTGRMRTKWTRVHTHEVFFRDTANGFLAWAVATVATAIVAGTVLASVISDGAHLAGKMAAGPGGSLHEPADAYLVDSLFRTDQRAAAAATPEVNAEATRILMHDVSNGGIKPDDRAYLTQLVVAHTGVDVPEAQKRVDGVINEVVETHEKLMEAADKAHKTSATVSLFTFLSLLVGAFIACVGAAVGGRERDLV